MSDSQAARQRCIFPINPDEVRISHPIIGDVPQDEEDLAFKPREDNGAIELTPTYVWPKDTLKRSSQQMMTEEGGGGQMGWEEDGEAQYNSQYTEAGADDIPDGMNRYVGHGRASPKHDPAIDLFLYQHSRRFSVVFPRSLLLSEGLSLFDIRLVKNQPHPMANSLLGVMEVLVYLCGDGIDQSWKGKLTARDKGGVDEAKEYAKRVKEWEAATKAWNAANAPPAGGAIGAGAFEGGAEEDDDDENESAAGDDTQSYHGHLQLNVPPGPPPVQPRPPYLEDEQLADLFKPFGFTLEGSAGEKVFRLVTPEGQKVAFPRAYMDIEHVYNHTSESDAGPMQLFDDPEAYIFHFTVLDPRICLLKGLERTMRYNSSNKNQRMRKLHQTNANIRELIENGAQDDEVEIYNPRDHSLVESLLSWNQWQDHLKTVCAMPKYYNDLVAKTSQSKAAVTPNSYLDPFKVLDPRRLFAFWKPMHFQYERFTNETGLSNLQAALAHYDPPPHPETTPDPVPPPEPPKPFDFKSSYTLDGEYDRRRDRFCLVSDEGELSHVTGEAPAFLDGKTSVSFHRYLNSYAVVRVYCEDLDSCATLDSILPNFMKNGRHVAYYPNRTAIDAFPPLSFELTEAIRRMNQTISARIRKGGVDASRTSMDTTCDNIRNRYFTGGSGKYVLKPEFGNIYNIEGQPEAIRQEIFMNMSRALASHSPHLPRGLFSVIKYHDQIPRRINGKPGGGIYPDFEPVISKPHIRGTDPTSRFCDWWVSECVDGPIMSQVHTHTLNMFHFMNLALVYARNETQSMVVVMGPPSTGKSRSFLPLFKSNLFIPDTVTPSDSMSQQANNTGGNFDGSLFFSDEAGDKDPIFSGGNAVDRTKYQQAGATSDKAAEIKLILCNGYLTRHVNDPSKKNNKLRKVSTSIKGLFVKMTNHQVWKNCEDAIRDRSFFFFVGPCRTIGGVNGKLAFYSQVSQAVRHTQALQISTVVKSYQIFCAYVGCFMSCNAIFWSETVGKWLLPIYWARFVKTYKDLHGNAFTYTPRFATDRFHALVYSAMLLRVWVESSDFPTVHLDGQGDKGFYFEQILHLAKRGAFVVQQRDFIAAMSFCEDMIPHRCQRFIVRWLIDHVSNLDPDRPFDLFKSATFGPEYWDEVAKHFDNGVAGIEAGGVHDLQSDVNYINARISAPSVSALRKTMATKILQQYESYFYEEKNQSEVVLFLEDMVSTETERHETHSHIRYIRKDGAVVPSKKEVKEPIMMAVKRGDTFHLLIQRSWLENWVRNPKSYFANPAYDEDPRFESSPVHRTLQYMWDFKGATPGVVVLPGMNLSRMVDNSASEQPLECNRLMTVRIPENLKSSDLIEVGPEIDPRLKVYLKKIPGNPPRYLFDPKVLNTKQAISGDEDAEDDDDDIISYHTKLAITLDDFARLRALIAGPFA